MRDATLHRRACALLALCLVGLACARGSAEERFLDPATAVTRVLDLADQRLALMPGVAAAKWQSHAPILDAERERAVIKHAGEVGEPLGLAAAPVEDLFALQARLARDLQSALQQGWSTHGFDFPDPVPVLATQLRPQLDTLTTQMLRAVYLAAPILRQPGFTSRYTALAAEHLHSSGWSDQSRHELLGVLATVRQTSGPTLARIAAAGVLRVGVTGDYAPFSLETGNVLSGADIQLARELAERLHVQPVFIRTSWATLMSDLADGAFDVAMGGISVTPERTERGAFSVPYASGGKTILARCRDASRYRDLAAVDRPRVRVIVNPGGTNEQYVRTNLHRAQIRVHADNRTIFDELLAGRADVMITDDAEVELQIQRHRDLCRTSPGTLTHSDKAILMPRDPALVSTVNAWLQEAIAAGEPGKLLKEVAP
jgi:cyclohexadienyl dehydratase